MTAGPTSFPGLPVLRAAHRKSRPVQHVRVNHRRRDVAVPEQFLHRADVGSRFEQVRGEAVAQRVAPDGPGNIRLERGEPDGALERRLVEMVATRVSSGRIDQKAGGRGGAVPARGEAGYLAGEAARELGSTGASLGRRRYR